MTPLWHILGLWRGRAGWLVAGLVMSLAALAAAVAITTLSGTIVAADSVVIASAAVALGLLGPLRVLLRYAERLVTHDATFRALADLRVWLFRGLAGRAAGGLGFRRSGDMLARLVDDVAALDGLYLRILLPVAGAVLLLPLLVWRIGRLSPLLAAAVALLFGLAAFVLPWIAARKMRTIGARLAAAMGGLREAVLDSMTGLRELRAFGAEDRMLALVQSREAALLSAQHALATRSAAATAAAFLCGQAAILVVLFALATAGLGAPGVAVAFLVFAAFEAVAGLPRAGIMAGHASAAAARLIAAAEAPMQSPDPPRPAPLPPGNDLRFEHVHFRWQPDHPPVFDGLTLDIPAGSRVALVGPSGAGKSTLAALALKVVAPQRGRVLLGGVDLAGLAAADIRQRIGLLGQATHLFDDSIRANLRLARSTHAQADPALEDAALWAALDAARIGDFVRGLPDGLDSWLGEGGAQVSGGQRRRLALARALLSPCAVLILDEPCAGLDADTEREFFETLNATANDRSVILIAHRLTGVERLDRIWRLGHGRAVAAAG